MPKKILRTAWTFNALPNNLNSDKLAKVKALQDFWERVMGIRTSAASMLSAIVACTLVISYGVATLRGAQNIEPATAEYTETYTETDTETYVSKN